jgi:hypothetical protein
LAEKGGTVSYDNILREEELKETIKQLKDEIASKEL